jgi:hypothetical protein
MNMAPEPRALTPAQTLRKEELLAALAASREQMKAWRNDRRALAEQMEEKRREVASQMERGEQLREELKKMLDTQSKVHQDIITELKELS